MIETECKYAKPLACWVSNFGKYLKDSLHYTCKQEAVNGLEGVKGHLVAAAPSVTALAGLVSVSDVSHIRGHIHRHAYIYVYIYIYIHIYIYTYIYISTYNGIHISYHLVPFDTISMGAATTDLAQKVFRRCLQHT